MKSKLVLCSGGCGRYALRTAGMCRKCMKSRTRKALKRVKRAAKGTQPKAMKRVGRHG